MTTIITAKQEYVEHELRNALMTIDPEITNVEFTYTPWRDEYIEIDRKNEHFIVNITGDSMTGIGVDLTRQFWTRIGTENL